VRAHAERLYREDPELITDGSQLLPTSPHDYDFDALRRDLLDSAQPPMSLRTT